MLMRTHDENETMSNIIIHNTPTTNEQKLYRKLFHKHFGNNETVIPYFWMPSFVEATDASARTLSIYKDKIKNE